MKKCEHLTAYVIDIYSFLTIDKTSALVLGKEKYHRKKYSEKKKKNYGVGNKTVAGSDKLRNKEEGGDKVEVRVKKYLIIKKNNQFIC